MGEVQRNFRSSYLEKVGIKGVEEKKSLDIILKDRSVDIVKLKQFCQRFSLPAAYRTHVWKLILGILPSHLEICDFVKQQRQEQYEDLKEMLTISHRVDSTMPRPQLHLRMFLTEQGRLPLKEKDLFTDPDNRAFLALSLAIGQIEDDDVDCYWITKKLLLLQIQTKQLMPLMAEQLELYLKKDDPQLYSHLHDTCSLQSIPTTHWFLTCFAATLPESAFERVCDRVIGGAGALLIFTGLSILITLRHCLLSKNNTEDIVTYFEKLPEESGDIILTKALEIWQRNGCPLTPVICQNETSIPAAERGLVTQHNA